jgi:hypothetical protein
MPKKERHAEHDWHQQFEQRMSPVDQYDLKRKAEELGKAFGAFVATPSAANYLRLESAMKHYQEAKYPSPV